MFVAFEPFRHPPSALSWNSTRSTRDCKGTGESDARMEVRGTQGRLVDRSKGECVSVAHESLELEYSFRLFWEKLAIFSHCIAIVERSHSHLTPSVRQKIYPRRDPERHINWAHDYESWWTTNKDLNKVVSPRPPRSEVPLFQFSRVF